MKKILTILITIIITSLLSAQPGFGAEVYLKSRVGFGGYVVPGTLMPVLVEINRTVVGGRLEIINLGEAGAFSIIDSYPVQNSKRIEAPIFINENIKDLKIRLISGEQVLVETELSPEAKMFPGNLVLAVKTPASTQHVIERALFPAESVLVAPVQISDLPGTALNYDGVSGLVLSDPGPVFTPVQVQALKVWLAGGGQMALGAVRSGENSLLSALGIDTENLERSSYQVGFGRITVFRRELADLTQNTSEWKDMLNLKPYTQTSRLMVNKLFPEFKTALSQNPSPQSSKAASYLTMVLIFWVISGLAVVVPVKRNRMVLLTCLALLWIAAAFPIGNWLAGIWNRGAEIQSHTVLLPEVGWMLTDVKVRFSWSNAEKVINLQSSPWGGKVYLGEDSHGTVKMKSQPGAFVWSHCLSQAKTVAKTAGPGWVNLNGWFPYDQNATNRINVKDATHISGFNSETIIWKEQKLYRTRSIHSGGDWEVTDQTPDWLREESSWLTGLNRFRPETAWLIGRGSLPGILKIEDGSFTGGLWALPLSEEVLK